MQRKRRIALILTASVPAAAAVALVTLLEPSMWLIPCLVVAIGSLAPFFVSFEKRFAPGRELAAMAAYTALCVASRAAFYPFAQVKPTAALVIICAVTLGGEAAFAVGAMTMLVSNVIFGFGVWTPFQMLGLGSVGVAAALLLKGDRLMRSRLVFSLIGAAVTFFVYGFFADLSSVIMLSADGSAASVFAVYAAGAPMNAVFALTTFVSLLLFGRALAERTRRIQIKYGLFISDGDLTDK